MSTAFDSIADLDDGLLRGVPGVRRLDRAAGHAGQAAALGVGEELPAVLLRPGPGLVLDSERDRCAEARAGLRRDGLDVAAVGQIRAGDPGVGDDVGERAALDHRDQVAVDVARLVL
jgi:hypothetical protein